MPITSSCCSISAEQYTLNIPANARWTQNGITVAGGNGQGSGLNQLYNPTDLYVDDDQTIYVADYNNHRIVEWKNGATSGRVVAGGNGLGSQPNQLYYPSVVLIDKESDSLIISEYGNQRVMRWPRTNSTTGQVISSGAASYGLAMDSDGYLYVSDYSKHEVKRWKIGETNSTVVAGGNGSGSRLDQLTCPRNIFVDQDRSLYIADSGNHRVMKWMEGAKEGIVVAGGNGRGNGLTQLSTPWTVVVDQLGTIYVAEDSNHRVMRWTKGAREGSVIVGGNGSGAQPNQFNRCMGLYFDRQGNLFVADHINHRVQKFNIDPNSIK